MSVDCGPPVVPQHGSLENYTSTTEGSEVFYRCDQHLVPEGRMRANCTRNGWSPNPADLSCSVGMLTKIPIQLLAHLYGGPLSLAKQVLTLWLRLPAIHSLVPRPSAFVACSTKFAQRAWTRSSRDVCRS